MRNNKAFASRLMFMRRAFAKEVGLVVILFLFCLALSFLSDVFFTFSNMMDIIISISTPAFAALGLTFVIITGGIDLSVGAVVALAGSIAAITVTNGGSVAASVLYAIGTGVIVGLFNAFFITRFQIPPLIVTLASLNMVRGLQLILTHAKTIFNLGDEFGVIGQGFLGSVPFPVVWTLLAFLVGYYLLHLHRFGRHVFAVGGNAAAARICGVNVPGVIFLVYIISGVLSALGGVILVSRLDSAPSILGLGMELSAIAAAVIGGTNLAGGEGTIIGTALGVLITGVIWNAMNILNISPFYQQFLQGLIILLAVLLNLVRRSK
jgi:ribose transport system permease protein